MKKEIYIPIMLAMLYSSCMTFARTARVDSLLQALFTTKEDSLEQLLATHLPTDAVTGQNVDSLKKEIAFYRDRSRYDEVVRAVQRLIPLLTIKGDSVSIAICYTEMGVAWRHLGQLTEALLCFNKSNSILENCKTADILRYRINNLYNISVLYTHNKNFEVAERIARDCIAAVQFQPETKGNMCLLAKCYHSLAVVLCDYAQTLTGEEKKSRIAESIKYGLEAYRLSNAYEDVPLNLSRRTVLLGQLYSAEQSYEKANAYFNEALKICQDNDFYYITAKIYEEMASIANRSGEHETMAYLLEQSISYAEKSLNKVSLLQSLKTTYDLYRQKNNYAKALDYYERYIALKDSLLNESQKRLISDFEVKYETEKKETRISTLEELARRRKWIEIAGATILILTGATFLFAWLWSRQRRRKIELQLQQVEQEKQLIATQAVLDGEVQERTRLARDLHDSLGSILAAAKYNLTNIKRVSAFGKKDMDSYNKAVDLLDDSMSEMRRVAHHLMPDSLSRFGLKAALGDFCETLPSVQFAWYGDESRLDPKREEVVYRIAHELISNALKHSGAERIFVQIVQEPDRIALTVQDDGRGFDPAAAVQGMGLSNIRTRVASFGGVINIDSKAGEGTEINIELRIEN